MKDDLVKRLNAVVPYQGKSNTAFLCHEAAARIAALQAELHEQARIIGAGGERELVLMAKVEWLEAELEAFKRDVSAKVTAYVNGSGRSGEDEWENLKSLILPEPVNSLLVEAKSLWEAWDAKNEDHRLKEIAAIWHGLRRGMELAKERGE